MFRSSDVVVETVATPIVTLPNNNSTLYIQVPNASTIYIGGSDVTSANGVALVGVTSVITATLRDLKTNDTLYGVGAANVTITVLAQTGGQTEPIFGVLP